MAKRGTKVLQARKSATSRDDDSLLIRSAESLGRVIGSLQRQMQDGTRLVSTMAEEAKKALPDLPQIGGVFGGARAPKRKAAGSARKRARKTSGARKAGVATRSPRPRKAAGARKRKAASRRG